MYWLNKYKIWKLKLIVRESSTNQLLNLKYIIIDSLESKGIGLVTDELIGDGVIEIYFKSKSKVRKKLFNLLNILDFREYELSIIDDIL